ncbi:MAG: hypothetical protein JKY53_10250 [Flavobacteriales bacterium]|nr:hypothetical protein [Flavobacteriales bacterium]
MLKVNIIGFLFVLVMGSCGQSNKNSTVRLPEINYINDTIKHGLARYYYPNNVLKSEVSYNNGEKEGKCIYYYENGVLKSETFYKNDVPAGVSKKYYGDGKTLKSKTFWLEGKQFGEGEWYHKNGKLATYGSMDFYGNTLFVIDWDTLGNQTKYEGVVFSPEYYFSADTSGIKLNEELIIKIAVATPPKTKTILKMGWLDSDLQEMSIKDYMVTYSITVTNPEKFTLVTVGELYDLQGKLLQMDSVAMDIKVAEQLECDQFNNGTRPRGFAIRD